MFRVCLDMWVDFSGHPTFQSVNFSLFGRVKKCMNTLQNTHPKLPMGSMGLVYLPNFFSLKFMVNVGTYTIHGSYGLHTQYIHM